MKQQVLLDTLGGIRASDLKGETLGALRLDVVLPVTAMFPHLFDVEIMLTLFYITFPHHVSVFGSPGLTGPEMEAFASFGTSGLSWSRDSLRSPSRAV